MLDNRKKLPDGAVLVLGQDHKFTVLEELGRGGSCIVYHAFYLDMTGQKHLVRIKECYHCRPQVTRLEGGALCSLPSDEEIFEEAKQKFREAYRKNVELKKTLGLVNSTADAMNIYEENHTVYSVVTCVEGRDYRAAVDETIHAIFVRLLTLSKIIQKYHREGILYLDIKPENILVIPETMEHMVLFDFDSLIRKEDLKNRKKISIPFSDGYTAPELFMGDPGQICEASDIYSIGAIAFYKLFGRKPNVLDGSIGCSYDFALLRTKDQRYQPDFFRLLDEFLHKSIATAVAFRYQSIEELIPVLERLAVLSQVEDVFLYHQFTYHSGCFIGRKQELTEIAERMEREQEVLFLSGMGGIGKTELAKRYAYENRENYRKILFLPFAGSIRETVCGEDLRINKAVQGEKESDQEYYHRKLLLLKSLVASNDLILIDNFDVDGDEELENLLECPCRFLITTREDYSDYGYSQMEITKIKSQEELLELFRVYNRHSYGKEEMEAIQGIIELVECHTMTVELTAKYLRITGEQPQSLYWQWMAREGVTSAKEIEIRNRKDKELRRESINVHLSILFDLSGFSSEDRELMGSLCLLGTVRVAKDWFLKRCQVKDSVNHLENLIRRGWVEYQEETEKLSLHQIIMDLVYSNLKPDSGNCPHITRSMADYFAQEVENHAQRTVKNRIASYFMKRINGTDLGYARLCVYYCQEMSIDTKYIEYAEQICVRQVQQKGVQAVENNKVTPTDVCSDSSAKAKELLWQICILKIQSVNQGDGMYERMLEEGVEFDEVKFFEAQSLEICSLAKRAFSYAKKYTSNPVYLGKVCTELAFRLQSVPEDHFLAFLMEEGSESVIRILELAEKMRHRAEHYFREKGMEIPRKEESEEEFLLPDDSLYDGEVGSAFHLTRQIVENYDLYRIEKYPEQKQKYWERCVQCFSRYPKEDILEENVEFLLELLDLEQMEQEKLKQAFAYLDRINISYALDAAEQILHYIIRICQENPNFMREQIMAYLRLGENILEVSLGQAESALYRCQKAWELYESWEQEEPYLCSRIHRALGECYGEFGLDDPREWAEKEKCDYYLLAEIDAKGQTVDRQMELWEQAIRAYHYLDHDLMEEKCCQRFMALMLPILHPYDHSGFERYWGIAMMEVLCCLRQGKEGQVRDRVLCAIYQMSPYYLEFCKDADVQINKKIKGKLGQCADVLLEAGWKEEATVCYLLEILVVGGMELRKEWFAPKLDGMGELEALLRAASVCLHGELSLEDVDDVIQISSKIMPMCYEKERFEEFLCELKWFLGVYQYQDVEFKR